ncbi:hypothetical protein ACHAQA_005622 [Verticillium albo-atrum]
MSVFVDGDISCPIPNVPESVFGDCDWFLAFLRHARILSRTYSSLFSVGVANKPNEYYTDIIDQLSQELENWRMLIPDNGFRPCGLNPPSNIHCSVERAAAVAIHYFYDGLRLTLARATLHHLSKSNDPHVALRKKTTMDTVLSASRSVLEKTILIDVESSISIWILAGIPITGLFVLFDVVIHSPLQEDTPSHLALLDMAGGHFSRIEYMSRGSLPGSLISEFAHIARDYVNDVHQRHESGTSQTQALHHAGPSSPLQQRAVQVQMLPGASDVSAGGNMPHEIPNVSAAEMPDFNMAFSGFPVGDYVPSNQMMGTDVMGIFNYFLPDMDPMFYQGINEEYDFGQGMEGGGLAVGDGTSETQIPPIQ